MRQIVGGRAGDLGEVAIGGARRSRCSRGRRDPPNRAKRTRTRVAVGAKKRRRRGEVNGGEMSASRLAYWGGRMARLLATRGFRRKHIGISRKAVLIQGLTWRMAFAGGDCGAAAGGPSTDVRGIPRAARSFRCSQVRGCLFIKKRITAKRSQLLQKEASY